MRNTELKWITISAAALIISGCNEPAFQNLTVQGGGASTTVVATAAATEQPTEQPQDGQQQPNGAEPTPAPDTNPGIGIDNPQPTPAPTATPAPTPEATPVPTPEPTSVPTPTPAPGTNPDTGNENPQPTPTPVPDASSSSSVASTSSSSQNTVSSTVSSTASSTVSSGTNSSGGCDHDDDGEDDDSDADSDDLNGIWLNVSEVHVSIKNRDGKSENVIIATSVGLVNLKQLSHDLFKTVGVSELPAPSTFLSASLVLYSSGSEVIRDGSRLCDLKVPSGDTSGFKIKIDNVEIKEDHHYTFKFSYDAEKALKILENGSCIMSPPVIHATYSE